MGFSAWVFLSLGSLHSHGSQSRILWTWALVLREPLTVNNSKSRYHLSQVVGAPGSALRFFTYTLLDLTLSTALWLLLPSFYKRGNGLVRFRTLSRVAARHCLCTRSVVFLSLWAVASSPLKRKVSSGPPARFVGCYRCKMDDVVAEKRSGSFMEGA